MAQSKYSKRRPQNGPAYRVDTKNTSPTYGMSARVIPAKRKYLPEYELGIFIDDWREMSTIELPKAKEWKVFKGLRDVQKWLDELEDNEGKYPLPANAFISFDHYLEKVDDGRFTGDDCFGLCKVLSYLIAEHVDIQGHSADPDRNTDKVNRWYKDN